MTTYDDLDDSVKELLGKLVSAIDQHRVDTGMNLNPEHFRIRIHPATWAAWNRRIPFGLVQPKELLGFRIEGDIYMEPGKAQLESTWTWVL